MRFNKIVSNQFYFIINYTAEIKYKKTKQNKTNNL